MDPFDSNNTGKYRCGLAAPGQLITTAGISTELNGSDIHSRTRVDRDKFDFSFLFAGTGIGCFPQLVLFFYTVGNMSEHNVRLNTACLCWLVRNALV